MGGVCSVAVNLSSSSPDKELWSKLGLFLRLCWLQKRDAPEKPIKKRPWNLGSWAQSQYVCSPFADLAGIRALSQEEQNVITQVFIIIYNYASQMEV